MNYNDGKDIFVFMEQRDNVLQDVSLELIGEAKRIAKTRETKIEVVGVVIGNDTDKNVQDILEYAIDRVIVVDQSHLKDYDTLNYTDVLEEIIETYHPEIFLFGGTVIGRDLAPRLSARVHTGLTADATHLAFDEEDKSSNLLYVTRPAFGGNLLATILCENHKPQMSTIRPGVFDKPQKIKNQEGKIIAFNKHFSNNSSIEVIEIIDKKVDMVAIENANVIVSAGRGARKCLDLVHSLAKAMKGEVGASRALIDEGLIQKPHQVGQTGKTVKPSVYIACGISGAIQHTAGMEKSKKIIAINTDESAPIFQIADLGIVADAKETLKHMEAQLISQKV
jgi:electron transfer flavoprotein alpha subunit